MRHAEAESAHRYAEDRLRPLTAHGQTQHEAVARRLAPLLQPLDHILTSPILRARQTAEIMASALTCANDMTETPFLADACTVGNVIRLLQDYAQDARILCIGHQPYMSRLSATFLDGEGRSAFAFEPGSAVGILFQGYPAPGSGMLRFFLRPTDILQMST